MDRNPDTSASTVELLTEDEHKAMDLSAALSRLVFKIIRSGGTDKARSGVGVVEQDLNEAAAAIHVIQRMILTQAAARAYPYDYRLLGNTVKTLLETNHD